MRVFDLRELLATPLPGITCRPTHTAGELKAAASLVYREYVKRGYINPSATTFKLSIFHALPDTTTFVAIDEHGTVAATLALIPDSPLGLPMDEVYRERLNDLRNRSERLAEVSMFATDTHWHRQAGLRRMSRDKLLLTLRLFKTMFDYARLRTWSTQLVACFHPRHEHLYELLHLEPLGGLRTHAGVNGHPAKARHLDIERTRALVPGSPVLQFFYQDGTPAETLAPRSGFSWDDLHDLFIQSSPVFLTAQPLQLGYLQHCYPSFNLCGQLDGALAP